MNIKKIIKEEIQKQLNEAAGEGLLNFPKKLFIQMRNTINDEIDNVIKAEFEKLKPEFIKLFNNKRVKIGSKVVSLGTVKDIKFSYSDYGRSIDYFANIVFSSGYRYRSNLSNGYFSVENERNQ